MGKFKKIRMNFDNAADDSTKEKSDFGDLMNQSQAEESAAKSKLKQLMETKDPNDESIDSINLRLLKQMQKN